MPTISPNPSYRQRHPPRSWPRRFWERLTEGSSLVQLWGELKSETLSSYRLYARDWEVERRKLPVRRGQRKPGLRELFWAIFGKLSPAKRVVLLLAFLIPLLAPPFAAVGTLLLLGLLVLEIASRVTLKRDLEIAREIQLWLLPTEPPPVAGAEVAFFNRPANTVSGDIYDAFWRDQGRKLVVTVADVAGKGVPAALLMATYQAGLHALCASGGAGLDEITNGLNRQACAHSAGGERFTTAFIADYDPAARVLRYVNAGHNPPMLRRVGGGAAGAIERLEAGGPPLGILPEAKYAAGEVTLAPGDVLLIYSDGVTEACNPQGVDYGEPRLEAALAQCSHLAAQDALRAVIAGFDQFVAGAPRQDDVTCLVLRRAS